MTQPPKPCPWCGKPPIHLCLRETIYCMGCRFCDVTGPRRPSEDLAIAAWNTRHQPEMTPEQVERMARYLYQAIEGETFEHTGMQDEWRAIAKGAAKAMQEGA